LDVLVRDDLLNFLKHDSETRGATILCEVLPVTAAHANVQLDATHIFDGLNNFPTHVAHMRFGSFVTPSSAWPIIPTSPLAMQFPPSTTLYNVALQWLKEDRDHRRELENRGRKRRGARRDEVCLIFILVG
jgi:CCR4-NOT complex subunit CAF16